MADSTKIPVSSLLPDETAPEGFLGNGNPTETVAPRPSWMRQESNSTESKPPDTRDRQSRLVISDSDASEEEQAFSIKERLNNWFKTAAAAGYGLSLLLHGLILLLMALWFFPQIKEAMSITTVVQSETEELQPFDAMDDVHLEKPAGSEEVVVPQLTEVIEAADLSTLETKFLKDVTASDTQGDGGSSGIGSGGFRLLEPKNAVKAGSFTAWTIPIAEIPGEKTTAGDSPRPGQDYHIVIQVRMPANRNSYNIADLSGKVIGTDGYVQVLPLQAYFQDEQGRMVRAKLGRQLPIIDGVVQIIIRVPGAEALVKDTIHVKSKLLKENQKLEIVFGKHSLND